MDKNCSFSAQILKTPIYRGMIIVYNCWGRCVPVRLTHSTKSLIVSTFKDIAEHCTLSKISVLDTIKAAAIAKNTFYYHFYDKYDLITYIFRQEFSEYVTGAFPPEKLICATGIQGEKYNDFAFYVNMRSPEDDLNLYAFWELLGSYIKANWKYYKNVLYTDSHRYLSNYLLNIYNLQMVEDIIYELHGRAMPRPHINYLAAYFNNSCTGMLLKGFETLGINNTHTTSSGEWNMTHRLLKYEIASYFAERE
jgi:AcrR family transcriptional regulator